MEAQVSPVADGVVAVADKGGEMNKRIKELVKQAGGHFSTHNLMSNPVQHRESIELWDDRIEKFAELILILCADICKQEATDNGTAQKIEARINAYR